MKVRCDRADLVDALNTILGIISPNSPKPILADFFLYTESGSLVAEATDLELTGRVFLHKLEVQEEGAVALPSAKLLPIIKEIPEESIHLESREDASGALIESNGFEFKIVGDDPAEFPRTRDPEISDAIVLKREKLHESLKRVSVAASRDPTRYQLNGVYLEIERGKISFTATDGRRLTHDHFKIDRNEDRAITAILPNQAVEVFLKALSPQGTPDEEVTLAISDTHAVLKTRESQICSTLVDGIFPNYRSVFPPEPKVRLKARRTALLSAARSASLTADRQTSTVVFRITGDAVVLESAAQDVGESRIRVPIESTGDATEVRFNPIYFIDALRTFEDDDVQLELTSPDKPVILRSSQNFRHLLMPLVPK